MITPIGTVSVGVALPATVTATGAVTALAATAIPTATGAISALAGLTLPELTGKAEGYVRLMTPSPSIDIATQLAAAATSLAALLAQVSAIPGGAALAAALTAAIGVQIAALEAIKGFNPALGAQIEQTVAAMASMNASIAAGISGPNINLSAIAARLAEVEASLTALAAMEASAVSVAAAADVQANIAAGIDANLAIGGLRLYRFDGDISTAGAELQAQISADGLSGSFHFVVMLPTSPSTWTAVQATVKTS